MTDHCAYGERAGPYAFETLPAEERREFETHLDGCRECRREVSDAAAVAESLGRAVTALNPPAGLRERVIAAAREERPIAGTTGARGRNLQGAMAPWLLAAASLAAIGLGLYAWMLHGQLGDTDARLRSAQARLSEIESQVALLRRAGEETSQATDVLSAPDVVRVDLAGQADAPGARGRAFWSPTRGLVLAARDLPDLPQGRVYQLWVVTASAKVSAGVLRPDADGRIQAIARVTARQPTAIALTIEPDGGVPEPTGAAYLLGTL